MSRTTFSTGLEVVLPVVLAVVFAFVAMTAVSAIPGWTTPEPQRLACPPGTAVVNMQYDAVDSNCLDSSGRVLKQGADPW